MADILRNISILWSLVHCIILFMLLFESRYPKKKTLILTGATITPLVLLNLLSIIFVGLEKTSQLIIITCIIPSFILFFIMAENRDMRFIFTFCLVDTIAYDIIIVTGLIDTLVGLNNSIVMFILRLLLFPLTEIFVIKKLRNAYHNFQREIKKGWGLFSMMSIFFYALLLIATTYPTIMFSRPDDFPVIFLICAFVPIMYSAVFRILHLQSTIHSSTNELQILDMQAKLAEERIASDAETEHRLKTLRHDLRHHMLLLNDYIKTNQSDKALEHISSVTDYIDSTMSKQFCLNSALNATLSHYANLSELKGINFICEISLSRQLPLSDIDLVVIFSNALENAVNALEICDTKRIEIKGFESDGKFFFEVKNPFCGEVEFQNGLPVSHSVNHGYGTKSIASMVEKHEGMYSFTVEDDIFVFRCAI